MKGRKPTPTHLRLLQGNPHRRPIPEGPEPRMSAEVPTPPAFLSAYAREEWQALAPELHRLGLLTVLDVAIFGAYCAAYGRWRTALEGIVTGVLIESPRKAAEDMLRFAAEFGMTPVARSRIARGVGGAKPVSKFGDLLARPR